MESHNTFWCYLTWYIAACAFASVAGAASNVVDYVIVGAGPAGLVLAEYLSRDPSVQVVLVEAGPDGTNNANITTPAFAPLIAVPPGTEFIWNFTSQPDPNLGGLAPPLAQGHALGGGTAVNYMGYFRGSPGVFDQWATETGMDELQWSKFFDNYLETSYYATQDLDYEPTLSPSAYGNGPLEVTAADDNFGLGIQFIREAATILDVPMRDLNAGYGVGATTGAVTIRANNHTREYALEAFGWQMAGRENVQIKPNTLVEKINFDGKRAIGVTVEGGSTIAAKETIISAGAINSPKLLMLSGIGPEQQLKDLGITVVCNQPDVGSNLADHHFSVLEYHATPEIQTVWQWSMNRTSAALYAREYEDNHTGPLGTTDAVGGALARIPNQAFNGVPNASFYTNMGSNRGQLLFQASTGAFIQPSPNFSIISPFVALVQPQAKGYIRLNSTKYADPPLIYSNYYGSPADKAAILYGYKKLREIMLSQNLAYAIVDEVFPGKNVTSDKDLWHAIQTSAQTFHHPVGTVALGKVLDNEWRVKGVQGLRVVDSSTFPSIPDCHLQATVYAYANLAAKIIVKTTKISH